LYFVASGDLNKTPATVDGSELWRTDGTVAGTIQVRDILPGTSSPSIAYLTPLGNQVFFRANDGTAGSELWKSDGTPAGTVMVADLLPGTSSSSPTNISPLGSRR